ncbi:MAG: ABC transporter ATP-binding protein [Candidatus Heimdallarchaeota archaeon]|nr:ABC transporter ATP-binding protein [Candidatus Heimdallarchaeota archaeon]
MKYAVEITNLTKSYGNIKAVDNISLKIPVGSIFGYLGPNGAGKTTTMKILTGLLHYPIGSVKIFGEEVNTSPSNSKQAFGFLPDSAMPKNYTIQRFLTVTAQMHELANVKGSVHSVLKKMGLAKLRNRKIGSLSKGQGQRVGLANALIADPPLLILDEPNSGLDPLGRVKILKILKDLADEGKTIFLSSHIIGEVDKIATDIAIINEGKLIEFGKREELQSQYLGQSRYIVGGKLDVDKVTSLEYVVSCDIDHLGRYILQVNDDQLAHNELLLDLIQKVKGHVQFFSSDEMSLENHFLEKINGHTEVSE